jgi:hypothetical protein
MGLPVVGGLISSVIGIITGTVLHCAPSGRAAALPRPPRAPLNNSKHRVEFDTDPVPTMLGSIVGTR